MSEAYEAAGEIAAAIHTNAEEISLAVAKLTDALPTLRDYFAAQVMQDPTTFVTRPGESVTDCYKRWAETCYQIADAMLKARQKGTT